MTYKKTRLSYFLWFIYICVTGVMIANYTMSLMGKQTSSASQMFLIGLVFLFFALVMGLYFLLKKAVAPLLINNKYERMALIVEVFVVLTIFIVGILYRLYICVQGSEMGLVQTNYYQMALVREGSSTESLVHGTSYLYVRFLSFIFSFLGNKIMVAVWTQIIIQLLTILSAYFAIRKILGKIAACMVMFILSVSTIYSGQILEITPESLLLLLYIAGIFVTGSYVNSYCQNNLSNTGKVLGAMFAGIVVGILAYLDAISLTLLIILAGIITGIHGKDTEDVIYNAYDRYLEDQKQKVVSPLLFILSVAACAFAIAGAFALDSFVSGDSIDIVYNAWIKLYTGHPWFSTGLDISSFSLAGRIVQLLFSSLLIPTFWNQKEFQNSTPWMCIMLFLAPVPLSTVGILNYQVFYVFIWGVLTGLGLQQSLVSMGAEEKDKNVEEDNVEAVVPKSPSAPASVTASAIPASTAASAVSAAQVSAQKPRFIENPLPLPKKHEKKELDYQYFVPAHKMKYDINVPDDDDFDI